jgi:four helix bundle protein
MGELYTRTKAFAVRVVRLFQALPKGDMTAQVLGKQLLRSGTSVGAQYREANRARSRAEFLSKIEACLQELEETQYWFELLIEAKIIPEKRLQSLLDEAGQLTAMLTASAKTSKTGKAR